MEQIDDLVIFVRVDRLVGSSGTLGSAGPCFFRAGTRHPLVGLMSFDPAVVTEAAVLHEMAHVIGFGILWDDLGLLEDPTNPQPAPIDDTHFRGTNAISAFDAMIAATARISQARVATRDFGGFEGCGLELINPWQPGR